MELKIGLLYLGLHNQLVKRFGVNNVITRREFFAKIGRHFIMPKNLRPLILKEMEEKKLIEKVDRDNIKILSIDIDIETEQNKLFCLFGLIT